MGEIFTIRAKLISKNYRKY